MQHQQATWLKGTLPTWLVAALLSIITWFITRYVNESDERYKQLSHVVANNTTKIAVVEQGLEYLKDGQDNIMISIQKIEANVSKIH